MISAIEVPCGRCSRAMTWACLLSARTRGVACTACQEASAATTAASISGSSDGRVVCADMIAVTAGVTVPLGGRTSSGCASPLMIAIAVAVRRHWPPCCSINPRCARLAIIFSLAPPLSSSSGSIKPPASQWARVMRSSWRSVMGVVCADMVVLRVIIRRCRRGAPAPRVDRSRCG